MKIASLVIPLLLASSALADSRRPPSVGVGGDVPKPGWVEINNEGETLRNVLAKAGIDLEIHERSKPPPACPLRIVVHDSSERIELNPASDAKAIATTKLRPNTYVVVRDFRSIPGNLKSRRESLAKYIEFGSTDLAREITGLAESAHEYAQWEASTKGEEAKPIDDFLKQELRRLFSLNDGHRIVGLLTLHTEFLHHQGLNFGHPRVKEAKRLVALAEAVLAKRTNGEQDAADQLPARPESKPK